MGSILFRQTFTYKFAPLKSIKKLFPVPVGGAMIKREDGNSFDPRFTRFHCVQGCDKGFMMLECWRTRFKHISWIYSQTQLGLMLIGGKVARKWQTSK